MEFGIFKKPSQEGWHVIKVFKKNIGLIFRSSLAIWGNWVVLYHKKFWNFKARSILRGSNGPTVGHCYNFTEYKDFMCMQKCNIYISGYTTIKQYMKQ